MLFRKQQRPPDPPPPREPLRCSFCNKSQRDVEKLIAGPGVYICIECVAICNDIVADDKVLEPGTGPALVPAPPATDEVGVPIRCALCKMLCPMETSVAFPDRGWLCEPCLDNVRLHLDSTERPVP
jgi:hypothetical protein